MTMAEERKAGPMTNVSRREFLSYAWGAATAVFAAEVGGILLVYARPRFKVGEFGGRFDLGRADQFDEGSVTFFREGKFILLREGGEFTALYQVCTHLGCLVRWDEDDQTYSCPCHGQKFAKDGTYVYGPAPRSLDSFAVRVADGQVVVDTGQRTLGAPA
jgi:cytochrome b6-f complex iron-sulfur subunit